MANGPDGWAQIALQAVEKHASGIVIGAVVSTVAILRAVKSGFLVFGDKAKLLVENAVLKEQLALKDKEIARLQAKVNANGNIK